MAAATLKQIGWDDQALELLQPSAEASPWWPVEGLRDCMGRSHLYELTAGEQRALVAVRGTVLEGGRLLEVTGLRSLGTRITPQGVQLLEDCLRQVYAPDLLSMATRHQHLARTCLRAGWTAPAQIITKFLGH